LTRSEATKPITVIGLESPPQRWPLRRQHFRPLAAVGRQSPVALRAPSNANYRPEGVFDGRPLCAARR
jgi:hypothetical protein